jgi:hypothetical protein
MRIRKVIASRLQDAVVPCATAMDGGSTEIAGALFGHAGIQSLRGKKIWMPALAGMTKRTCQCHSPYQILDMRKPHD